MREVEELRADERWAAASDMAHLVMEEDERRGRSWRQFWQRAAVHVVFWAVVGPGVLFLLWMAGALPDIDLTRLTPAQHAAVVLIVLTVVINAFGVELATYTRRRVNQRRSVVDLLDREERKIAKSQVAGTTEVDETKLPVLITLGRENQRTSGVALIRGSGAVLASVAIALYAPEADFLVFAFVLFAGVAVLMIVSATTYRRAVRFLRRHGGSDGAWVF